MTFTLELPAQLLQLGHADTPAALRLSELVSRGCQRVDTWGSRLRTYLALNGARARLDPARRLRTAPEITAALGEPLGFAGYAVLSLLAAADLCVEFGLDPEQALRVGRSSADLALLDAAHQVASTVRDPDFRASRLYLVHVYRRQWQPAPPPQPEALGERLAALPERDTRLAYLAHLSAVWSAPATADAAGLRALVPLALEDDTTLDIVLARWVASRAAALTAGEIEAMITDCERDLAHGSPWELGAQKPPDVSDHAWPRR